MEAIPLIKPDVRFSRIRLSEVVLQLTIEFNLPVASIWLVGARRKRLALLPAFPLEI